MIVTYLGKNISEYRKNILKILCCSVLNCPTCGLNMKYHSSYGRHVHIGETVEWITVYRFECTSCDNTHAILPDFICPRKHYTAYDIEMTLRGAIDNIPAERMDTAASISTVKRWLGEFREKISQVAGGLKSLLYILFNKAIGDISLIKLSPFKLLERVMEREF